MKVRFGPFWVEAGGIIRKASFETEGIIRNQEASFRTLDQLIATSPRVEFRQRHAQ